MAFLCSRLRGIRKRTRRSRSAAVAEEVEHREQRQEEQHDDLDRPARGLVDQGRGEAAGRGRHVLEGGAPVDLVEPEVAHQRQLAQPQSGSWIFWERTAEVLLRRAVKVDRLAGDEVGHHVERHDEEEQQEKAAEERGQGPAPAECAQDPLVHRVEQRREDRRQHHRHEEDLHHAEEDGRGAEQDGDEEVAAELSVVHGVSAPFFHGWHGSLVASPWKTRSAGADFQTSENSHHVETYVEARDPFPPGPPGSACAAVRAPDPAGAARRAAAGRPAGAARARPAGAGAPAAPMPAPPGQAPMAAPAPMPAPAAGGPNPNRWATSRSSSTGRPSRPG